MRSRTLTPDSGLDPSGSASGELSPIFLISSKGSEATAAACGCHGPLFHGAHHSPCAFCRDDRFLELKRVPPGYGPAHRLPIFFDSQHSQGSVAVIGEVAVQIAPAPPFGGIHAHDRVTFSPGGLTVHGHVLAAAQGSRGMSRVYADLLTASGAQLPEVRGGKSDRSQARGGGFANSERRRQNRVRSTVDLHVGGAFPVPSRDWQQRR